MSAARPIGYVANVDPFAKKPTEDEGVPTVKLPSVGSDFEAEKEKLDQRRALLRSRAAQSAQAIMPEGQFTKGGKYFIAPHWTQQLSAALKPGMENFSRDMEQAQIDQKAAKLHEQQQANAADVMSQIPQPREIKGQVEGPVAEGAVGPGAPVEGVVGTQEPTQQEKMAWMVKAMGNPLTRGLAQSYGTDVLIEEPKRAEARAARAQEKQAEYAQREQALQAQLEDKRLDRESREKYQADLLNLRREMVNNSKDYARARLGMAGAAATEKKNAAEAKKTEAENKPLPPQSVKALADLSADVEAGNRYVTNFKDEYAGPTGSIKRGIGTYSPVATQSMRDSAEFWSDYQGARNKERHKLFGSALTEHEKAEYEKSDINPSMAPEQIRKNLQRRSELQQVAYERLSKGYTATNRKDQLEALKPKGTGRGASGDFGPASSDVSDLLEKYK